MRKARFWTQQQLATLAKTSLNTVKRWESRSASPVLDFDSFSNLARAFGLELRELAERISASEQIPDGIDPRKRATLNPVFEIDVVAGRWADVPIAQYDTENPEHRQVLEDGRFQLRIIGDCMEPPYPNGSTVQCRLIRTDLEAMPVLEAYVFCRNDGTATFKALVRTHGRGDEAEFELAAINQDKYPRTFRVLCSEIGRVAKVEGVVFNPVWTLKLRE